ncbi:hypothetical protein [Pantoea agglomerans]|nr:hypothetical protein [Pantoea agglomerans]WNK37982.1 hypothetical protein RM158_23940 [Pantoea agglomerans]WNK74120.1 hypothetical protein RM155_23395 [Pantoea agglomerans]
MKIKISNVRFWHKADAIRLNVRYERGAEVGKSNNNMTNIEVS